MPHHLGLAVVLIYLTMFFFVYLPWKFRKIYRQQKALHSPIQFQFSDIGFTATTAAGQMALPWAHFHKWKEGRLHFLLYYSDVMFTIVPKRFFERQEDIVEFRNL